jgi:hypothetical protein
MPNLEGFKADRYVGVVTKTEDKLLRDYLETKEKIDAFKKGITKFPAHLNTEERKETYREARIDSTVTVITYKLLDANRKPMVNTEGKEIANSEFFNIPTITGWGRSKLKDVRDLNNLSWNTVEWVGKDVWVYINKEGYLRLLPE